MVNSDAEVLPGALAQSLAYLEAHPDAGLVGGQLLWPDGRLQTSWGQRPDIWPGCLDEQTFWGAVRGRLAPTPGPSAASGRGESKKNQGAEGSPSFPSVSSPSIPPLPLAGEGASLIARDVDQISGAYMVIRREAWQAVGGFDPAYFMYNEDVDLNVRLRRAGWRVVFLPDVQITHHLGASSRVDWQTRARMVAAYNQSRYYYFTRYGGPAAGAKLKALCLLGAAIRLTGWSLLSVVKPQAREKVKLFREVWRRTWAMKCRRAE